MSVHLQVKSWSCEDTILICTFQKLELHLKLQQTIDVGRPSRYMFAIESDHGKDTCLRRGFLSIISKSRRRKKNNGRNVAGLRHRTLVLGNVIRSTFGSRRTVSRALRIKLDVWSHHERWWGEVQGKRPMWMAYTRYDKLEHQDYCYTVLVNTLSSALSYEILIE